MNRLVFLLIILILQISCYPEKDRVVTISGKLIDSPIDSDMSKYELTVRSIFGTKEETLCSTYLDSQGTFKMQYSVSGTYVGNNLRIALYPSIGVQEKFEFCQQAISEQQNATPTQHKQPLRVAGAMEAAAKTHRALAQLAPCCGHQGRQLALGRTFRQGDELIPKTGAAIGVGEKDDFFQLAHGCVSRSKHETPIVAQPTA